MESRSIVVGGITAALLLLSAAHHAAGQSLVSTVDGPFKVAASYGYSQVHHDGEWILVDVGIQSERNATMRLHKAFSLVTPDGERIDLPSQREYRTALADLRALNIRAGTMQLNAWRDFSVCKQEYFGVRPLLTAGTLGSHRCRTWRLWGNGGVEWTAALGPLGAGGATLYFHSPEGWPAGEYWLEVDGPGDLEARLPVRLH